MVTGAVREEQTVGENTTRKRRSTLIVLAGFAHRRRFTFGRGSVAENVRH